MKTLVQDYIFDKTNKRVIFTKITPSSLEEVLLITNVSTGDIIYNFADKLRGGALEGNVLTLTFDTSQMNDTDSLQVFIESDDYQQSIVRMLTALSRSQQNYSRDSADRMRVIMDNSPMLYNYNRNTSATLNAATEGFYSSNSWNSVDAREPLMEQNRNNIMVSMQRWSRK